MWHSPCRHLRLGQYCYSYPRSLPNQAEPCSLLLELLAWSVSSLLVSRNDLFVVDDHVPQIPLPYAENHSSWISVLSIFQCNETSWSIENMKFALLYVISVNQAIAMTVPVHFWISWIFNCIDNWFKWLSNWIESFQNGN